MTGRPSGGRPKRRPIAERDRQIRAIAEQFPAAKPGGAWTAGGMPASRRHPPVIVHDGSAAGLMEQIRSQAT